MKMKQPIVIMATLAVSAFSVKAQTLEDGIKMYNYERYESAKTALSPLAASNPVANYYLGLSELQLGNVDAAKSIFAKYPDNYANVSGAARASFAKGMAAEGAQTAQGLAAKAKKKDWEQYKFAADALTYSEGANYQQAIDWYKAAQANNANNNEILLGMGDAYQKIQGGGGQAMSSYEKIAEKDPKNSLAFSRIGKLWYDAKNYPLALEAWEKAKNADPNNPIPYGDLADAYFYSGKYELAKQNVEKYLELSDKSTADQIRYATILYLTKDYANTARIANELLGKGVNKANIYGLLAFSQYETKDSVNALNNVRTYFAMQDPKKIGHKDYITYGHIHLQNGNTDSADYYYTKGIEADPSKDKAETYKGIADGYIARKTTDAYLKAGQWYGRIVKEKETPAALDYYYWGVYNYYGRNYATAAQAYELMETKYPDQPSATYWRGRVAAAQDDEAKTGAAVPFYTKWLDASAAGYKKSNADLMQAYQYLALYYYNQNDKGNTKKYMDQMSAIDPNNAFLKQLQTAMTGTPKTKKS